MQRVTETQNWRYVFENLPVYANGQKIIYTISEDAVYEYITLPIEGDAETGFTVTNQYLVEPDDDPPPLIPPMGDNIVETLMVTMLSMLGAVLCLVKIRKRNANA